MSYHIHTGITGPERSRPATVHRQRTLRAVRTLVGEFPQRSCVHDGLRPYVNTCMINVKKEYQKYENISTEPVLIGTVHAAGCHAGFPGCDSKGKAGGWDARPTGINAHATVAATGRGG